MTNRAEDDLVDIDAALVLIRVAEQLPNGIDRKRAFLGRLGRAYGAQGCRRWVGGKTSATYPSQHQYPQMAKGNGQNGGRVAAVVACEIQNGPAPSPKHEVHHICFDHRCVNPEHMIWVTRAKHQAIHAEARRLLKEATE